jgi:zinc and cadmium transporter
MEIWLNTFLSVLLVSSVSLIGILFLALRKESLEKLQLILVALATGGLLGGAFFHLLPESFESISNLRVISVLITFGFLLFFILERFLHWHHNHTSGFTENQVKPFGALSLISDSFHNFLDGLLIAAAFSYSFEIGIATTFTVLMHELPQEIGDFGILIHAGYTRKKALFFNFLSACTAFAGAFIFLLIGNTMADLARYVLPFAAGGFIYLAAADLIPELHTEKIPHRSVIQFMALLLGMSFLFFISMFAE